MLFVSFVCPHFPLVAPAEYYYKYPLDQMPLPKQYAHDERPQHPYLRDYSGSFSYDKFFDAKKVKKAIAAYYGLCTFLDDNIGKVLRTLDATGLTDNTRVLYTSDHGDNLAHGDCGASRRCTKKLPGRAADHQGTRDSTGHKKSMNRRITWIRIPFILECAGESARGNV
jgi:arylsulfatase A-like enzyme